MFSKIVRRTHMYLALFLIPWVLGYALSTMAMNHREHLRAIYGEGPPPFTTVAERPYAGVFPEGANPEQKAAQILGDLGMDGAHVVAGPVKGEILVINRADLVAPKRITYNAAAGTVRIEEAEFRAPAFLERLHRRRGYQQNYATDDTWAFLVDLFIVAMLFWVGSGLWMWWEMRLTRRWGAVFACAGLILCAAFLVTI
jgi:hypothetical protein